MEIDCSGLLPYQPQHLANLFTILHTNKGAALDASDTGVGKTFTALAVARALNVTPLVVTQASIIPSWEDAGEHLGVEAEIVSYNRIRGVRTFEQFQPFEFTDKKPSVEGYWYPVIVDGKPFAHFEKLIIKGLRQGEDFEADPATGRVTFLTEQIQCVEGRVLQCMAESAWTREVRYGKGSMFQWKNSYEMMIFDEVHNCAGMVTASSKILKAAKRGGASKILCMSATAADRPLDLNALGFVLGIHDGKDFYRWLMKHGYRPGYFGGMDFTNDPEKQSAIMSDLHHQIFPARGARLRKREIPGFPETKTDVKLLPYSDEAGKLSKSALDLYESLSRKEVSAAARANMSEMLLRTRQRLEVLMVPDLIELAVEFSRTSKVAIFVNFVDTLNEVLRAASEHFKFEQIAYIIGDEERVDNNFKTGLSRDETVKLFQANQYSLIVSTTGAGGVGISLHDPTGQVDRTTFFTPVFSAKQLKQLLGRVDRAKGAYSEQYLAYIKGTYQEKVAKYVRIKLNNIDMMNDNALNGML